MDISAQQDTFYIFRNKESKIPMLSTAVEEVLGAFAQRPTLLSSTNETIAIQP